MRGDTLQLQEDKLTAGALEAAWGPGSVPSPVTGGTAGLASSKPR